MHKTHQSYLKHLFCYVQLLHIIGGGYGGLDSWTTRNQFVSIRKNGIGDTSIVTIRDENHNKIYNFRRFRFPTAWEVYVVQAKFDSLNKNVNKLESAFTQYFIINHPRVYWK